MDRDKLDALRRKYADARGGDIFDPAFAAVAEQVFTDPERRKWPFAEPATFLGAPYRPDAAALPDFGGLDVALIGVPMDLGWVRGRCVRSSASDRTSTRCASRRLRSSPWPTSATCRCKAASISRNAIATSRRS
jgi:hypothetical protein